MIVTTTIIITIIHNKRNKISFIQRWTTNLAVTGSSPA